MSSDRGATDRTVPKCNPVEKGTWTMLIFSKIIEEPVVTDDERPGPRFGDLRMEGVYYAFLTRDEGGRVVVADVDDFIRRTVGDDVDPALEELLSKVSLTNSADDGEEGEDGTPTALGTEPGTSGVDWSKLKLFHEDEAKSIVDTLIPAYEEAREVGERLWAPRIRAMQGRSG